MEPAYSMIKTSTPSATKARWELRPHASSSPSLSFPGGVLASDSSSRVYLLLLILIKEILTSPDDPKPLLAGGRASPQAALAGMGLDCHTKKDTSGRKVQHHHRRCGSQSCCHWWHVIGMYSDKACRTSGDVVATARPPRGASMELVHDSAASPVLPPDAMSLAKSDKRALVEAKPCNEALRNELVKGLVVWVHADSLGIAWTHLDALGLTWSFLHALAIIRIQN